MPLLEIYVLIQVGQLIGGLETVALVVLTTIVGVMLLRKQGSAALLRARTRLNLGELPTQEAIEGAFFAIGGVFLLVPGFVTDLLGFACLVPWVRRRIIAWGLKRMRPTGLKSTFSRDGMRSGRTLDGEYRRDDDKDV